MKAMVSARYGPPDVLEFKEVETPTPADDEVLVKIHAASVNAADWHFLRATPFPMRLVSGLFRPKHTILGADIAGRIETAGNNTKQFKPGDEVFGDLSDVGWGGFAEYVSVPESALAMKPANATFEEAAAVPLAAVTALQGLRNAGKIQSGQRVAINGASGAVGTFAVLIAKAFDTEVTAVCSTGKLDTARSIGADHVVDYTQEDFTEAEKQYDLILGVNGYHPLSHYKRALSPAGTYVMVGGSGKQLLQGMLLGPSMSRGGKTLTTMGSAKPNQDDLVFMRELIEGGKVTPFIERRYPLSELPQAILYVEQGHAGGKVVITIAD